LAIGVTLVAVTVGAVVTAAAVLSGTGPCAGPALDPALPVPPVDDVCYHLVRSMAERAGLLSAVLTAIVVLTVVGLSRVLEGEDDRSGSMERTT
jgi:hypothetical protein